MRLHYKHKRYCHGHSPLEETKVQPVEPVLYYVRVGSKDIVTIDTLPTDTLANVRDEIAEEVGGFRYLKDGVVVSRSSIASTDRRGEVRTRCGRPKGSRATAR